jgi:hypothetical protein
MWGGASPPLIYHHDIIYIYIIILYIYSIIYYIMLIIMLYPPFVFVWPLATATSTSTVHSVSLPGTSGKKHSKSLNFSLK